MTQKLEKQLCLSPTILHFLRPADLSPLTSKLGPEKSFFNYVGGYGLFTKKNGVLYLLCYFLDTSK